MALAEESDKGEGKMKWGMSRCATHRTLCLRLRHHETRQAKLERLGGELQKWLRLVEEIIIQEKSKDHPNSDFLKLLQKELDALKGAIVALDNQNVDLAIEVLKQAFSESEEGMSWA